jgi:hypothetical protein
MLWHGRNANVSKYSKGWWDRKRERIEVFPCHRGGSTTAAPTCSGVRPVSVSEPTKGWQCNCHPNVVTFSFQPRREAVAHGVFGTGAGFYEMEQVLGAAGLAADAG